jgi:hypothetical protein
VVVTALVVPAVLSFSPWHPLEHDNLSKEISFRLSRASKHFCAWSHVRNDPRLRSDFRTLTDPKMPAIAACPPTLRWPLSHDQTILPSCIRVDRRDWPGSSTVWHSLAPPYQGHAHLSQDRKPTCRPKSRALFGISASRWTMLWPSPSRWMSELPGQSRLALSSSLGRLRATAGHPHAAGHSAGQFAHRQNSVQAAESERIRKRRTDRQSTRLVGHIIEITCRIRA